MMRATRTLVLWMAAARKATPPTALHPIRAKRAADAPNVCRGALQY